VFVCRCRSFRFLADFATENFRRSDALPVSAKEQFHTLIGEYLNQDDTKNCSVAVSQNNKYCAIKHGYELILSIGKNLQKRLIRRKGRSHRTFHSDRQEKQTRHRKPVSGNASSNHVKA